MILWLMVLILSMGPLLQMLGRMMLCASSTRSEPETTTSRKPMVLPISSTTSDDSRPDQRWIPGSYFYDSSINFDRYLQELGISFLLRQMAMLASPIVTITASGTCQKTDYCEKWSLKTDTLFLSHRIDFTLNQEHPDVTLDGRRINFSIRQSGPNQWEEVQQSSSPSPTSVLIRDFTPDQMIVTLKANDVISTCYFNRVTNQSAPSDWP